MPRDRPAHPAEPGEAVGRKRRRWGANGERIKNEQRRTIRRRANKRRANRRRTIKGTVNAIRKTVDKRYQAVYQVFG